MRNESRIDRAHAVGVGLKGLLLGMTGLLLSQCAAPPGGSARYAPDASSLSSGGATHEGKPKRAAEERPGLATGFGKSISDAWDRQSFARASSSPVGTSVAFYNDREGFEAMSGSTERADALRRAAGDRVEWGVRSGARYLPAYETYGWGKGRRRFLIGQEGDGYSVVIKNRCRSRLEVVLSVDGLDVIDGKVASIKKRGYVIMPGKTLEVKGWRTVPDRVAQFTFSPVSGSYANLRHGAHRNVGVIGLAVFGEKGVDPWKWMPDEVGDRFAAQPF